eukprot:NODE_1792_length_490_cov_139.757370_g1714_i0.p3 GENE.NODE_1792_length_490_cov_139.757370_g1714_i0~~NODE_1792_length_490_cov_139.757370_g1714_i0.p3  ORF type:complete len:148 (-),score=45.46 NODE_1792_length_490_cov_139.757370_g1714_i0:47-466(-)
MGKENEEHPATPKANQKCSKRSWDGQLKKWRRALHKWDGSGNDVDTEEEEEEETEKGGAPKTPVSTCSSSRLSEFSGSERGTLDTPEHNLLPLAPSTPPSASVPSPGADGSWWNPEAIRSWGSETSADDCGNLEEVGGL